ncbi:MAG: CpsD/CapB family tyrosine-protein kinase [Deltaproteobacteria bacterium]|nr:CpsD/CapB family tyrosine-protein kinase [Deltaproteobacteria bacterium]
MSKYFKALERARQERLVEEKDWNLWSTENLSERPSSPQDEPESDWKLDSAASNGDEARPEEQASAERTQEFPDGPVEEHLVSLITPASFEADQYRSLRYVVERLRKDRGFSLIAIASPGMGDGKTTTAINLAGALAQDSRCRVLLVDADLRGSSLESYLGVSESDGPGVVDAIVNPALSAKDIERRLSSFNLSILPRGHRMVNPYDALKSPRLGQLLQEARRRYDFVVVDTPPLIPLPDCRVIGPLMDGFLIVVAAHKTPRRLLEEALNVMDPAKVIGIVFNRDDRPLPRYFHYYTDGHRANGNSRLA